MSAPTQNAGTIVVAQSQNGSFDVTARFEPAALQLLHGVSVGKAELLPAGEYVGGPPMFDNAPQALVVDTGTTRITGALTGAYKVGGATPTSSLPMQTTPALRAYGARAGKLLSLENGNLVARDVAEAMKGNPSISNVPLTGDVPTKPLALEAWAGSVNYMPATGLLVLDRGVLQNSDVLRLIRILSDGSCAELWHTGPIASFPITKAFMSVSTYGAAVISYSLSNNTFEALSFRSDDGSPLRSMSQQGALSLAALTDGYGWIFPKSSYGPAVLRVEVVGGTVAVCGATWFQTIVGDQSGYPLGNPSVDCQ